MNESKHAHLFHELTEAHRLVLSCFRFSWDFLTVKEIQKQIKTGKKADISIKTIRRAMAKLVDLGILQCLGSHKIGRGYSNLYRIVER